MAAPVEKSDSCVSFSKNSNGYCSVPQCSSRKTDEISLHLFPKDKSKRKVWGLKLKIGKDISDYMLVCSRHFKTEDFILPGIPTKKRRLKKGAVPSMFLPVTRHGSYSSKSETVIDKRRERLLCRGQKIAEARACSNLCNMDRPEHPEDSPGEHINTESMSLEPEFEKEEKGVQVNVIDCTVPYNILNILKSDEDIYRFTGLESCSLFYAVVKCMAKVSSKKTILSLEGTVILALLKMKLGLDFEVIATFFNISSTSCRRYFQETVFILAYVFRMVIVWPSKDEVLKNIPLCFQNFRSVRVVLDCTEIPVQQPKCLKCRILTYSHFKGCHTVKYLLGVSPAGLIIFKSAPYGGRTSDKFITVASGILNKLEPYVDSVMVDKGFMIDDECFNRGLNLIRPPFLKGTSQLSAFDANRNSEIAKARVHVERAIGRLKRFTTLSKKLEWRLLPYLDSMVDIATGIVNLSSPILSDSRF